MAPLLRARIRAYPPSLQYLSHLKCSRRCVPRVETEKVTHERTSLVRGMRTWAKKNANSWLLFGVCSRYYDTEKVTHVDGERDGGFGEKNLLG